MSSSLRILAWYGLAFLLGCSSPKVLPAPPIQEVSPYAAIGFASKQKLQEHFVKHGREFSSPSAEAYLAKAQQLRDRVLKPPLLEGIRPSDGVITRFDPASGAFLAYDKNRTIRTFFKPDNGERYYHRQLKR